MKSDIEFNPVTDISIAIARSTNEKGESDWHAYILNHKPVEIHNLLIVSRAYENEDKTGRKTSTLRHYLENLGPGAQRKIERVDPAVFSFYNEFWLSFYIGRTIFDKKFVIKPFKEWEVEELEELNLPGRIKS
jgi:hypothetical protein